MVGVSDDDFLSFADDLSESFLVFKSSSVSSESKVSPSPKKPMDASEDIAGGIIFAGLSTGLDGSLVGELRSRI